MPEYFDRYILLNDENTLLSETLISTRNDLRNHKEDLIRLQDYQYAPDKWTPKDILQHIIDTERIMNYRALCLARNEQQTLMGYSENGYAESAIARHRSVDDLLDEFDAVRNSTVSLFNSFTDEMVHNRGICLETEMTPLALGFVIPGHATHHLNVFRERYFTDK